MKIIKTSRELAEFHNSIDSGDCIGFVPTMGALHAGHISLAETACRESNIVIVSIFVNPAQFNNPGDLKSYPRDIDRDLSMLNKTNVKAVFVPEVTDIYPEPDNRIFDFGHAGNVLEGKFRPGHFNGVAQAVSRLFDLVKPHKAFFGQKDFQQLIIIRKLVQQLNYKIDIISCPVIREPDGLAMSSRNQLLTPAQRSAAPLIAKTLFLAKRKQHSMPLNILKKWVIDTINSNPRFTVEYFDIVEETEFRSVNTWEEKTGKTGCIAVKIGNLRLIDTIFFD